MTSAINVALELLFNQDENKTDDKCQQNENSIELIELKVRMEEKDIRLKELYEQIKTKDNLRGARVNDLLDQLKVKDQQLEKSIHISRI